MAGEDIRLGCVAAGKPQPELRYACKSEMPIIFRVFLINKTEHGKSTSTIFIFKDGVVNPTNKFLPLVL